jgi:RND family efflux transporter MFP subunit
MPAFFKYALPFALLALIGCSEAPPPEPRVIPAVKTAVVTENPGGFTRAIAGVVEPQDSTVLSFPLGGTVLEVRPNVGDTVTAGQVLAKLDAVTLRNQMQSAQANVYSGQASLLKAREEYQRKKALLDKGYISKSEFDEAKAALVARQSETEVAQAQLDNARRDLQRAELKAPFSGVIAKRNVEPYQEVKAGEALFTLMGDSGLKVKIQVPETLISSIKQEDETVVSFPALKGEAITGRITEISAQAEAGNAYPVSVTLNNAPAGLRSGMSASVSFRAHENVPVFLIPLSALAMNEIPQLADNGGTGGKAPVFVFNAEKQTVSLRLVDVLDLQDNMLAVTRGLANGDEIVVAGTAFLRDGMNVRRWEPETPRDSITILNRPVSAAKGS